MNRFYIDKLIVAGGGHESSIIDFCPGVNFIIGPSNTGKSMVMDCIDYALGFNPDKRHPSKIVENSNGYERVTLQLITENGGLDITRQIGSTRFEVSGSDTTVPHGTYSLKGKQNSILDLYLKLLGIDEPHDIIFGEKGTTCAFTWRGIIHLFLMRQTDVNRDKSPLATPGGVSNTPSMSALLFLLTGQDANALKQDESEDIRKAKQRAVIDHLREDTAETGKDVDRIKKQLEGINPVDCQMAIQQIQMDIDAIQQELDAAVDKSNALMQEIYGQNGKLAECKTIDQNFQILRRRYQSDLRRLEFIIDGKIATAAVPAKRHCPVCGMETTAEPDQQQLVSITADVKKIRNQLDDLKLAQADIKKKREVIIQNIKTLEGRKKEIDTLISGDLKPRLSHFKDQLDRQMNYVQLYGELQALTRDNNRRKALLFEKENEEIPKDPKYKVSSYYDYGIIKGFEDKLIEILEASKFRGASSARLDMGTFDIEIDGHPKAATSGGGYCGILNCITAMAMGAYLIDLDRPAPGFFAVDSSLTQLSQGEHIALSDSIKQNFIRYIIDHADNRQIIFVEQKERMPFIPDENENVRVIEFTENRSSGRYGFLNDLYNPEV